MKKRFRPKTLTALTLRITALVMAIWLVGMACMTLAAASFFFDQLCMMGRGLSEQSLRYSSLHDLYNEDYGREQLAQYPGVVEFNILRAIRSAEETIGPPGLYGPYILTKDLPNLYRDKYFPIDTAAVVTDTDGNVLFESGDYLYFEYYTQEQYQQGHDSSLSGYGWLDLNDDTDERYVRFRTQYAGTLDLFDTRLLRITGWLDGGRVEPLAIAALTDTAITQATEARQPDEIQVQPDGSVEIRHQFSYAQLETEGNLHWDTLFDYTDQAPEGQDTVTIYARGLYMFRHEPQGSVKHNGNVYENLSALLRDRLWTGDTENDGMYSQESHFGLDQMVIFSTSGIRDLRDFDPAAGDTYPEPLYRMTTVLRASPLGLAMRYLLWVYVACFGLALLGVVLIRRTIKRRMVQPLREINDGMGEGWTTLYYLRGAGRGWQELETLRQNYVATGDRLQKQQNEVERLNTALRYAKTAEENRRQMTSHIAHELKTPLAVIHGYAEGLKERIAEDKREQYLDVILSETERMDAMVLEMLDLSRLEAGRVKLARDTFSLEALTQEIFARLQLAMEVKALKLEYDCDTDTTVTADAARMAQVVENFASNAVRYTPPEGQIQVQIRTEKGGTTFTIENTGDPLPYEALFKVWDTFYRTDESRTGTGTGLGLAIARQIVELHGGKCSVWNTRTGVAFRFTLP